MINQIWGIYKIEGKSVWLSKEGTREVDGLDFTLEPLLPYLEARFGVRNIYIQGQPTPIMAYQYKLLKNYDAKRN